MNLILEKVSFANHHLKNWLAFNAISHYVLQKHSEIGGTWNRVVNSSLFSTYRSGSALKIHLANFEFTSVKDLVICLPSGREHEAYTPGDTAVKTKTATVKILITEPAGPRGKIKDSS